MLSPLSQATFSRSALSSSYTLVPSPVWANGRWISLVGKDNGNTTHDAFTHESSDQGVTWSLSIQQQSTSGFSLVPNGDRPTINYREVEGNGYFVYFLSSGIGGYRQGSNDWVRLDLTSIPGATIGGGTITTFLYDDVNNRFVVGKSIQGEYEYMLTSDFVNWTNANLIEKVDFVSVGFVGSTGAGTVYWAGSNYITYGESAATGNRAYSTSTDLVNWSTPSDISVNLNLVPSARFSGTFVAITNNTSVGNTQVTRTFDVYTSSDGITWTLRTMPTISGMGQKVLDIFITTSAIEILTASHVFRSTNLVSWTADPIQNSIVPARMSIIPLFVAGRKADLLSEETPPDRILIPTSDSLQDGGKIMTLSGLNSTPTLQYPSGQTAGNNIGLIDVYFQDRTSTRENGFVLSAPSGNTNDDVRFETNTFYARSNGTRYCEVEILRSASTSNKISARALGELYVQDINLPATDKVFFEMTQNTITYPDGSTDTPTFAFTVGQIYGFLFDFTAQTCTITLDGVALQTVTDLNDVLGWVIEFDLINGDFKINVGQEPFSFNTTSATAWLTP